MLTLRCPKLVSIILASLTLLVVALPAQARMRMYNPELGTFMQRDPGSQPRGEMQGFAPRAGQGYQDGMSLYAGYFRMLGELDPFGRATSQIGLVAADPVATGLQAGLTVDLDGRLIEQDDQPGALPPSNRGEGWAAPGVNWAGPGWRYTAKARPTSRWDFVAKLHDFLYHVNSLRYPCDTTCAGDEFCLSRCSKADYIFIQLANEVIDRSSWRERRYNGLTVNKPIALFNLGEDTNRFLKCDGFRNILRYQEYPDLNPPDYLMLPWEILPPDQKLIAKDTAGRGPKSRYEIELPEDDKDWRDWATQEFGEAWHRSIDIDDMAGRWPN